MTLRVNLVSTFMLPIDFIQQYLPGSLFADAIDLDKTASEITLTNPDVTVDALQTLQDLTQGKEPTQSHPDLKQADTYLNIPLLSIYADPIYDLIVDRTNINASVNVPAIKATLQQDNLSMLKYLQQKGLTVNTDLLIQTVEAGALEIYTYLSSLIPVDKVKMLQKAMWANQKEMVKLLLADPELVVPSNVYWYYEMKSNPAVETIKTQNEIGELVADKIYKGDVDMYERDMENFYENLADSLS